MEFRSSHDHAQVGDLTQHPRDLCGVDAAVWGAVAQGLTWEFWSEQQSNSRPYIGCWFPRDGKFLAFAVTCSYMQLQEGGNDAQMFSRFKLLWGIIYYDHIMSGGSPVKNNPRLKNPSFQVKLIQVWILLYLPAMRLWASCMNSMCKVKVIILLHRDVGSSKQVISEFFNPVSAIE